jgi:flagellar basal body-associated protein FliL
LETFDSNQAAAQKKANNKELLYILIAVAVAIVIVIIVIVIAFFLKPRRSMPTRSNTGPTFSNFGTQSILVADNSNPSFSTYGPGSLGSILNR